MSNKEQLEDIANKNDDEETNLGAKTTSHEGTESIETRTDLDSKNIGKPTITCGTEIVEPLTNENKLDNTDTSLEDIKNLRSELEILPGTSGDAQLLLNKSGSGDIEKDFNLDESHNPLGNIKTTPQSYTEAANMINSDTEKVDEGMANEEKAIDNKCHAEILNIGNPADDNVQIDETDNEITKNETVEDQGVSNDSLDSIDKIDDTRVANMEGATELSLQYSDSNEDMLLRWDDDDEEEHAESNIDEDLAESDLVGTIDNDSKSPTHEQTIVKPVIETEISSTMDICDVEQTIDKEISKDKEKQLLEEDENLNNDLTEETNKDEAITIQNDNVSPMNEEPILKQSAPMSEMEVDTVISEINNDSTELNKKNQESSSIVSSIDKSTQDIDIKMDLDLSIIKEKNITTAAVDENSETSTEKLPQKSPVENKVDVHNPNTSVKEYSIDLSIVTGEVNGPERNADCHDLLQIKDQSHDSSFDDSLVVNTEHGLNQPDMMLEIPTQELMDFEDSNVDDEDEMPMLDETVDGNSNEIEQQLSSTETQENEKQATKENIQTLKEATQEKSDAVEPKDIESQTKKQTEIDNTKDINSQTKEQVEADCINKNGNQDNIQAVNTNAKEITKGNSQTLKEAPQKKSDTEEPKDIENQTRQTEKDKNKDVDSQTKGQAEQDNINKNDINAIQAVKAVESSKDGFEDKSLDSEKHSVDTVIAKVLDDVEESIELIAKEIEDQQKVLEAQPSTSTEMIPDTADEVPDVSDSLGLLAESSRPVEDDDDDVFDDEDFYQDDESSNQMTAEHSEDSNAPPSESDALQSESGVPKVQDEKELETPPEEKDVDFDFQLNKAASKTEVGDNDVDMESEKVISPEAEKVEDSPTDDVKISAEEAKVGEKTTQSVDIETVKLSDTSDNEGDTEKDIEKRKQSVLRQLLLKTKEDEANECGKQAQSKTKKLEIAQQKNFVNIVDLEESSEDDEEKADRERIEEQATIDKTRVTSVNIPLSVEVMTLSGSGGNMCEMRHKGDEVIITGVPKPPPHKPARLNTSEVTIKTASTASTLVIPEKKIPKIGLEIFNIDSDEDSCSAIKDVSTASPKSDKSEEIKDIPKEKCINLACKSDGSVPFVTANASTVAFFNFKKKRRPIVCQKCADMVATRAQELVEGITQFTPILDLDAGKEPQELVEISDSESEDESEVVEDVKMLIGEKGAKFLEENLADMINETWKKFKMDERLQETQDLLGFELSKLEQQSKEIDDMFNECQIATDKLRNELYATFEGEKQELPALIIFDTPYSAFTLPEEQVTKFGSIEVPKRRLLSAGENETPAKRAAIPLGYTPLDADNKKKIQVKIPVAAETSGKVEDDRDVSVVQLSAEAAPADLPPPGELTRLPIKAGMPVYAMRNAFGSWLKGKVLECQAKGTTSNQPFTMCRVKFDHKVKNPCKVLSARCLAYSEPADVRMTIGTRVIALCRDSTNTGKRDSFYAGVVAEIPNPVNNYRYLVFFDDGYAQYVVHSDTRLVCECSHLVWEEVHPFSREFVRDYLLAYPERPMVRLHAGQSLKTEWNGKWWVSRVVVVDASLVQVQFDEDNRVEWIYRGSTRLAPLYLELQAAERTRARPLPRSKTQTRSNMPYVEYTRTDEQGGNKTDEMQVQEQQNEEMRRQRAVAKKSTATPSVATPVNIAGNLDTVTSRVVYYTPKNAVRPLKLATHTCSPKCKRTDTLALKDLRTYNPLAKPLLSGWERQIVRFKGQKEVMYRAPCGRRVRDLSELHRYLRATRSDMPVDLFDFHPNTHCLAEFVLNKCNVGKKDLSHGKENVPVPCVNYYDDSLPEFCSYNTERTPTAGVPLNLDPDFLCGCDCTDDCADKTKCSCWKLTLEGARTIGLDGPNVGYSYKRLPEPLPSGIYECNSRCKCKHTCLNRVAQHPLQLKLQVFKTLNRGWGIRALNDVPKGAFLCVYAGNLLTDATANLDGLNEGDEYLAELDYIEVVEQMKEGFEEDIPEADKKLDKKESKTDDKQSSSEEISSEEDEEMPDKNDVMDDDFSPGFIGLGLTEFNKRLRKRGKGKKGEKAEELNDKQKEKEKEIQKDGNGDEDCITISDDEEVRQPSRFTAQAGMGANEFVPKYRSVRAHFGKDEACYIMDAKVQGNIGRYLNHSCSPNVFVQNVFVDTHDPRFPWVAFFALSHIRAGTELTWNYNYDIGSVPEKVLYCFCGAPNCRRRLL